VLAGEHDLVTEFKYTQELFAKIIAPEKKLYAFPEGRHELHNDFESNEFIDIMVAWIRERVQKYEPGTQCNILLDSRPSG
jgi:alpha-beta hydrolase superfamily lysophospholipase